MRAADLGHFGYLMSGPGLTKVGSDRLETMAKVAAKRFIDEKVPLNDTISKLAEENDLNRDQVERVCEMANLATHQALWPKTAAKESISFPLADAKKVHHKSKKGGGGEDSVTAAPSHAPKHKAADLDYAGPPRGIPSGGGGSLASMMGVDPKAVHNGMHGGSPRQQLVIIIEKKAARAADLKQQLIVQTMTRESLEKKAFELSKQAVFGGTNFTQIFRACCDQGLGKVAAELLPEFQERLIKETSGTVRLGLQKTAIAKAPEELISENLGNIAIVNGAHPLLVCLDTIQKQDGEIHNGLRGLIRIQDELKLDHQKLTELT